MDNVVECLIFNVTVMLALREMIALSLFVKLLVEKMNTVTLSLQNQFVSVKLDTEGIIV